MKKSILILLLTVSFFLSCNDEDDLFDINALRSPPNITTPSNFADADLNQ